MSQEQFEEHAGDDYWEQVSALDGYERTVGDTAANLLLLAADKVVVCTLMDSALVAGIHEELTGEAGYDVCQITVYHSDESCRIGRFEHHGLPIVLASDGALFIAASNVNALEALGGIDHD